MLYKYGKRMRNFLRVWFSSSLVFNILGAFSIKRILSPALAATKFVGYLSRHIQPAIVE